MPGELPHVAEAKRILNERVGFRTTPVTVEVERGMIRDFALATGETDRLHFDEEYAKASRFGGIVAPPTFVSYFVADSIGKAVFPEVPFLSTTLHTDDLVTLAQPVRVGDIITATARLIEVFERAGRKGPMLFQRADMTLTNQRGELVANVEVVLVSF